MKKLKKRDWKSFYFWVHKKFGVYTEFVPQGKPDQCYKPKVKNTPLLDEYGFVDHGSGSVEERTRVKMRRLFFIFATIGDSYPELSAGIYGFARPIELPPYDDNKSFDELCALNTGGTGVFMDEKKFGIRDFYPSEPYRKLFNDWRKEVNK